MLGVAMRSCLWRSSSSQRISGQIHRRALTTSNRVKMLQGNPAGDEIQLAKAYIVEAMSIQKRNHRADWSNKSCPINEKILLAVDALATAKTELGPTKKQALKRQNDLKETVLHWESEFQYLVFGVVMSAFSLNPFLHLGALYIIVGLLDHTTSNLDRVKDIERSIVFLLNDHLEKDVEDCIGRLKQGPVDAWHAACIIRTLEKIEQDLLRATVYGPF